MSTISDKICSECDCTFTDSHDYAECYQNQIAALRYEIEMLRHKLAQAQSLISRLTGDQFADLKI